MWFNQISFYPLNKDKLELKSFRQIGAIEFAHCQGLDWFSEGFATPVSFRPTGFPCRLHWRVALKKKKSPACRRHPRYFG